jgi:hypothetical protein
MSRNEYKVAAAAMNGRPQRLITVDRKDGAAFRDHINADSARSRTRFIRAAADKFSVEEPELAWLDDAIVAAADDADARADDTVASEEREERKSQATQLVELADTIEFFHDSDGDAYGRFNVDGHWEVAVVRSKHFRRWLTRLYYLSEGKSPSSQALQDAINVLEAKGIFSGPIRQVHIRVAGHEGMIYLDLCNDKWQVAEVSGVGWRVLDESPVMFRRAKAMLPLPTPVQGGSIDELHSYAHMSDDDWALFRAWLVAALRPFGPYPVLDLQGEHGSGKSTQCRMARALIDPNTAMLRSEPREPRDLMIAAKNGWVLAFDNLSNIPAWQSDCLCRLSTGGGFSTRTLYENDEEMIFNSQRPLIINGIDGVATRADLLDRCLLLNIPRIEHDQRRPEAELWASFEAARPRILGALLSAVSCAIRVTPHVKLPALPRMADFAIWATAAEPALGLESGQFIATYQSNRDAGNEVALEASPVGKAVSDFVAGIGEWCGTSTDLLEQLDAQTDEKTKRLKSWPKTAQVLGGAIKRLAPNLRTAGVGIEFGRRGRRGTRTIKLWCQPELLGNLLSEPSALAAAQESLRSEAFGADGCAERWLSADNDAFEPLSAANDEFPEDFVSADVTDDADDVFPAQSSPWDLN